MIPTKEVKAYLIKGKKKDICLQAITVIESATCWIEIYSIPEARCDLVAN